MVKPSRFYFQGIPVDNSSLATISCQLIEFTQRKRKKPCFVTYLNAFNLNLAFKNKEYRQKLESADLIYADGWGVVLVGKLFGINLSGRLTAKDFFDEFCQLSIKEKKSLFFLGGEEKIVKKMVEILRNKFNQIKIKGWYHGFFNQEEEKEILTLINQKKPDFLIIGMGSPKQELWLAKNANKLKIKVGWCVGGLFDFLSGYKSACPRWLGDLGFEWLFRLLSEPKRLWRRYLLGLSELLLRAIKLKFLTKK